MLDTNAVSHFLRSHPLVSARALSLPMASLCISSITEGELQFGLARRPSATKLRRVVNEFVTRVDVLPWDRVAAVTYGEMKARIEARGALLSPLDLLIAAHARSVRAILVSNDGALKRTPELVVEDWTEPVT